jgi:hypothetical protein
MANLSASQKKSLIGFYQGHIKNGHNVAGMKDNFAWEGKGPIALDYSLLLSEDKGKDAGELRSVLNLVGTVVRVENTPYKSNLYVSGADSHLGDQTIWQQQLEGLAKVETAFPLGHDFHFPKSGDAVICGIKLDAKHPAVVLNHEDKILEGNIKSLIKEGSLVVIHFIPYPWQNEDKDISGISFTVRKIKIVNAKHIGPTALIGAKRDCPSVSASPSPKKLKTSFIYADDLPSTAALSFITGDDH